MKQKVLKPILLVICVVLVVLCIVPVVWNQATGSYETLNKTDQAVLSELDAYVKAESSSRIWDGFDLACRPILAVNGSFGPAYLVNPSESVHSMFAKEIDMPQASSLKVYRIAPTAPDLLQFKVSGNFNTMGQDCSVLGNKVYFTKYDDAAIEARQSSKHYLTFLSHEAFHYFMQDNWSGGERFDASSLTDKDLDLMEENYAVFAKIHAELQSEQPDKAKLLELAREYVSVMEKRSESNPSYMERESLTETAEGTATYVGLNASKLVGYDYQIMHFSNNKPGEEDVVVPFDVVVPAIKDGTLDRSFIASNLVYDTGALLCELARALEVPNWQQSLNAQTLDAPVTLYSVVADYVQSTI